MIRLAVRVARADAAGALAALLAFSPAGVEEVDCDEDTLEYVLYGAPGELPSLHTLSAGVGEAIVEVSTTEIADDWSTRWRSFHVPVTVAGTLHVRPPWRERASDPRLLDIVIDPGQAFGTGAHATTRLCLELLVELAAAGEASGPMLDVGTGSGVLAIAAAKLGFAPVSAVDHDPDAVSAARENATANGVAIECWQLDLRRDELPPAATLTANLVRPLLLELAERLRHVPERLVACGLLSEQLDEVAAAFAERHGMRERARRHDGEWSALALEGARHGRILSGG
jgi:ribosomal protein L11 methyltransferase